LAIGGNPVVARLAGIRVGAAVVLAYATSGLLAGLGGVVLTSQLKNASPTYGEGYELTVIAAVVVGGASLNGGRARMAGTLTGALLIATIQNGMNLLDISPFVQKIVLGMVILIAVLLDRWRQHVVLNSAG
jgi:ribose transport system permease protein